MTPISAAALAHNCREARVLAERSTRRRGEARDTTKFPAGFAQSYRLSTGEGVRHRRLRGVPAGHRHAGLREGKRGEAGGDARDRGGRRIVLPRAGERKR